MGDKEYAPPSSRHIGFSKWLPLSDPGWFFDDNLSFKTDTKMI
jgi:hypothetical protein